MKLLLRPTFLFLLAANMLGMILILPPRAEPGTTTPPLAWTPAQLVVTLAAGTTKNAQATVTTKGAVPATTASVVPSLASYVSVAPTGLPASAVGASQTFQLTFTVPASTLPQTIQGTLHLRAGSNTIAQPLPITLTITEPNRLISAKGLELTLPRSWNLDQQSLDMGGPISFNNFNGAYSQGGLRPPGGAEIDVTTIALPSVPIQEIIDRELQGTTIESTTLTQVGGQSGTKVAYSFDLVSNLVEKNVAVYVARGQLLYKFFLSYRQGDTNESQFLSEFDQVLASVNFTQ